MEVVGLLVLAILVLLGTVALLVVLVLATGCCGTGGTGGTAGPLVLAIVVALLKIVALFVLLVLAIAAIVVVLLQMVLVALVLVVALVTVVMNAPGAKVVNSSAAAIHGGWSLLNLGGIALVVADTVVVWNLSAARNQGGGMKSDVGPLAVAAAVVVNQGFCRGDGGDGFLPSALADEFCCDARGKALKSKIDKTSTTTPQKPAAAR